ncbi:sensor histidine kinase [Streptomyces umbrinus]|uniref:sensor histidine kinase n=1 Tax=Streptomyces umbrinus TaxID=67370 RepID=UPI0027D7E969|nr:HAMP domain-containing sensor histidine kinase [Streptomyces umbrinus]
MSLTVSSAVSRPLCGVEHLPMYVASMAAAFLPYLLTGAGAAGHLALVLDGPEHHLGVLAAENLFLSVGGTLVEVGRAVGLIGLADLLVVTTVFLVASRIRRSQRRLCEVERAARQLGEGDLTSRVPPLDQGPLEVRRVVSAFNDMADAVHASMEKQAAFVVDASHQLRNPLTVLSLRMEMLSLSLEGKGREEVELIREEMNRLDIMLGQLLDLASARGAFTVRPGPVDAVDLVADRVTAWRPQAEHRSVSLDVAAGLPAVILADAALAGSILDTVLDNAIKFSPEGGRITVRLRDHGTMTSIEVSDEGPGLAPADFLHIGNRFWRGSTTRDAPGTGLGLSIAREMAAVMGGQLTFAAVEPHGLCVALHVPRTDTRRAARSSLQKSG